jgi:predicted Zn-dependent protease
MNFRRRMYLFPSILLALFSFSVSFKTDAYAQGGIYYWNVDKLLSISANEIQLVDSSGKILGEISKERLLCLQTVKNKIEQAAQLRSDFYIVTGDKPNAFATNITTGRNLFAINIPMLQELGDDVDAMAALIGHELAHIKCNHIRQNIERAENINAGMQVVNALLIMARVPLSGVIAGTAGNLAFKTYSRDQEREADTEGTNFVRKAGLNPYGAVRLHTMIMEKGGDTWFYITSTHPPASERIQNMRAIIANEYKLGSEYEKQVSKLQIPSDALTQNGQVSVSGDRAATVFDNEERTPTLYKKIKCRLPDRSEIVTTPVDCVQKEGMPIK